MVDLPGRKIVTGMQPPRRRSAPGSQIEVASSAPSHSPTSARPAPRLLASRTAAIWAGRSFAQPLDQRRIAQAGEPGHFGPSTRFPQRHAAAAICQCQPQQRCRILDLPRPRERAARPRRSVQIKIGRQVRLHLRPAIQDVRTNRHPKLESHRGSWRLYANLAPMTPNLSPARGLRPSSTGYAGRGSAPPTQGLDQTLAAREPLRVARLERLGLRPPVNAPARRASGPRLHAIGM